MGIFSQFGKPVHRSMRERDNATLRLFSRYFSYADDTAAEDDEKVAVRIAYTNFLCVGGMPSSEFPSGTPALVSF